MQIVEHGQSAAVLVQSAQHIVVTMVVHQCLHLIQQLQALKILSSHLQQTIMIALVHVCLQQAIL